MVSGFLLLDEARPSAGSSISTPGLTDFFLDDVETKSDVRTPEARKATLDWVMTDLIPALDITKAHGRCAATPLDPEALPYQLERAGWKVKRYPVEYQDKEGKRCATWPDRVPLEEIDRIKATFEKTGSLREYNQEYMCKAEAPGKRPSSRKCCGSSQ